jgi:signal transduction histidine kinase/ligand-binding sensor domain-containing protein/DNA-binding response OmpR family regulator
LNRANTYLTMKTIHCLLLLQLFCLGANAQTQNLKFEHLDINAGLSQNHIMCMLQDNRGFMWFGTSDGLNKYDGYKFTVYKNDPKDSNSISNNYISGIVEDEKGNLWVTARGGGLNRYDKKKDKFTHFINDPKKPNSLSNNLATSISKDADGNLWISTEDALNFYDPSRNVFLQYNINARYTYEDKDRQLWIGTYHDGLALFNKTTRSFTYFRHDEKDKRSISNDNVSVIFEDSKQRLWVGTVGGGLNLFDRKTGKFQRYVHMENNENSLPASTVFALEEDAEGKLWIGTENGGIAILNPNTDEFDIYQQDEIDNKSISHNSIYCIYRDNDANMWSGTFAGGLNLTTTKSKKFGHHKHTSDDNSLSNNNVLYMEENGDGKIWIATDGGGLNLFDPVTQNCVHYIHEPGNKNSICGDYVLNVTNDSYGNTWIGAWDAGLTVYNQKKKTYRHFKNIPGDNTSLSSNNAWVIFEDSEKNIWVSALFGGLNLYNPATNSFTRYNDGTTNSSTRKIKCITEDNNGNLLLGTDGAGIQIFNKRTKTFTGLLHDDNRNSISDNRVTFINQDKLGNLWIGTMAGLNYYNTKKHLFTIYTNANGLPNNVVFGLLEDAKGILWISTNRGLSRFDPQTKKFTNFGVQDGLQSYEFKIGSFCKSRSGIFYFGGINGFNEFDPLKIKDDPFDPPLVLTNFEIFNKTVPIARTDSDLSPLKENISETKEIVLSHSNSVFSFEFASLNFAENENKKYAYMLEGFDKGWNEIGTKRTATYTNLNPGKYIFKVKGMNSAGQWSARIVAVRLIITPPYWLTWWFKTLVLVSLVIAVIGFYKYRMHTIQTQKRDLEQKVEEQTWQLLLSTRDEKKARQEADEANKAKSVFLATMSHEIRTPMNGVIGMAALLNETPLNPEQQEYAKTISTCGEALLTVINDILDFSKIESGNMELESRDFDLRTCIEEVLDVFADKAGKLGLDLVYQIDANVPAQIVGDSLRLRQVLMNLVSNAIKFTKKGEIFVGVHLNKTKADGNIELRFEVRDTGIGIPADKIERLFKAFSQVDSSTSRKYGGTGLGLVICEKIINLMGGKITVQSEEDKGTRFIFNILSAPGAEPLRNYVTNDIASFENSRILVIDDNLTNRCILKNQLELWKLTSTLACDAHEALQILSSGEKFDLVLTDMQMPGMDGCELAQHIQQLYPVLPVILLSSVGDERNKRYAGLFGSILTKPIKQELLSKAIVNELRLRSTKIPEANQAKQKLSIDFAKEHPLKIMVAEDNLVNQKLALKILSKLGIEAALAENGKIAVEKLQQQLFDIILMDMQMPEMDGLEATRVIRKSAMIQPIIIAMTANAMKEDRDACLKAGMDDFLSKPVKLEELVNMLTKWSNIAKAKENDKQRA